MESAAESVLLKRFGKRIAKLEAEPIIKRINNTGQQIAKKHKVKYYPVDFINLMR